MFLKFEIYLSFTQILVKILFVFEWNKIKKIVFVLVSYLNKKYNIILARTPEIGKGLGRILICVARKPEQT